MQVLRRHVAVLVFLALGGFALSLMVQHAVLPHTSGNADEVVYRFQASMFSDGQVTLPDDGPVLRPWMSGVVDGERIMVFPPGWPAILAVGEGVTGSEAVTVALVIAMLGPATWWFVRELTRDRRTAAVGGAAMLVSPFVIVHSGTLLSYLPALVCQLVFGACVLRALRTGRMRILVVGGLALGVLFSFRPLDAGLIVLPFAGYALAVCRARLRSLAPGIGWGALGAFPMIVATLAYNARVSGSALLFPIEAAGGNNAFGFGIRNIAEGTPLVDFTLDRAVRATVSNLVELPQWIPGVWVGAGLVVVAAVVLWRTDRAVLALLAAIAVLFPLVYLFYWGTLLVGVGRDVFGPFYYYALWIPAVTLIAVGIVSLWDRRHAVARLSGWALGGAAVLGAALATAWVLRTPLDTFDLYTQRAQAQVALMDDAPPGSFVVLPMIADGPWILQPWNQYANTPGLDGPVVYGADAPADTIEAIRRFADRRSFSLLAPEGPGNAGALALEPLTVQSGETVEASAELTGAANEVVWAYAIAERGGHRCRVELGPSGRATVRWAFVGVEVNPVGGCSGVAEVTYPVPGGQRPCVVGVESDAAASGLQQEERFWCQDEGSGASISMVTPGEPRTGTPTANGRVAWSALPRVAAETRLRVVMAPRR